jgi:hypothetical protein
MGMEMTKSCVTSYIVSLHSKQIRDRQGVLALFKLAKKPAIVSKPQDDHLVLLGFALPVHGIDGISYYIP